MEINVNAMRTPTEINLNVKPGECWFLRINGQLVFQGVGPGGETRDELELRMKNYHQESRVFRTCREAVEQARNVEMVDDHIEDTPKKKRAAYARGLLAGLLGETVPPPGPFVFGSPNIPPESTWTCRCGYACGEAIMHCAGFRRDDEPVENSDQTSDGSARD